MKKIFTLLISLTTLSSVFAQSDHYGNQQKDNKNNAYADNNYNQQERKRPSNDADFGSGNHYPGYSNEGRHNDVNQNNHFWDKQRNSHDWYNRNDEHRVYRENHYDEYRMDRPFVSYYPYDRMENARRERHGKLKAFFCRIF